MRVAPPVEQGIDRRQDEPGLRRQYDGKVKLHDVSRFDYLGEIEPGIALYTAVVNSPHFKRNLRLAYGSTQAGEGALRRAVFDRRGS